MIQKNSINNFLSVFTTNKYVYETNQSIDSLRNKIILVLDQKKVFNFKYNLTGKLNSDNSFQLSRRAGFLTIKSWDRDPVTIKGKLIQNQTNSTKIEIDLKPNFIFVLFPFLLGTIGIGALIYSIFSQNKESIIGGFFLIIVPVIWLIARHTKNYYKTEFEKALDLPKNDIILKRTIKL